jgi:hypothetical protein
MAVRYRLVFRGKYLPGLGHDEVLLNLSGLFRLPVEQLQAMLEPVPAVIRKDVSAEDGNRYQEALLNAGLITHLEAATDADGNPLPEGWDGIERRVSQRDRRSGIDRRGANRDTLRPDRRHSRGRRKTD